MWLVWWNVSYDWSKLDKFLHAITSSVKIAPKRHLNHLWKIPGNFDEVHQIILAYVEQEINKIKAEYVLLGYNTFLLDLASSK